MIAVQPRVADLKAHTPRVYDWQSRAGVNAGASQYVNLPGGYVAAPESVSQKGAPQFPLTTNYESLVSSTTLRNNMIYVTFQRAGQKDPSNTNTTNAQSTYVVINVARVTVTPPSKGFPFRTLNGAFVESYGTLNVSSLGPFASAFYPALTVDAAGNTGELSSTLAAPCDPIRQSCMTSTINVFPGCPVLCYQPHQFDNGYKDVNL